MERQEIRMYEDKCTQNFAPACNTMCPMHVDVKAMLDCITKENFDEAAKIFTKSIIFPNIISKICDHPCQNHCKRKEMGGSILISDLERSSMKFGKVKKKILKPIKRLNMKVAIIGAGLDGLAAALFLYEKGYQVTVFDKNSIIGGEIIHRKELNQEDINEDFRIFENTNIEFRLGNVVDVIELSDVFEGVYDTYNPSLDMFNVTKNASAIEKLCNGRSAGITLDRKMKNVSITEGREFEGPYETKLFVQTKSFEEKPPIKTKLEYNKGIQWNLSKEESIEEAKRCIQCECLECVKECAFLQKYKSYPKKYVREIANNVNITMGIRQTKNMVNSCTFCGLCGEICPNKLNMADVCRNAKLELVENNHMPEAFHDFPINDMLFSNSEFFQLLRHQSGMKESKYLFFPGCQLGALEANHVINVYEYLINHLVGGVGIFLGCCGSPAEWSGRATLFNDVLNEIKEMWKKSGKPIVITACATCSKVFKSKISDIEIQSLWEIYSKNGVKDLGHVTNPHNKIAIHDACTARYDMEVQEYVRNIIQQKGYEIEELKYSKDMTKCCSYGGLVTFTNKEVSRDMIQKRIKESDKDYVVYCAMCKERFTSEGKSSWHILDLIYGDLEKDKKSIEKGRISFSQRHENRIKLKRNLLQKYWGVDVEREEKPSEKINIVFADNIEITMDERLILVSDIQEVILYAESTGNKIFNPNNEHYIAKLQPGVITYWVEYSIKGRSYIIHKAYTHRLEINKNIKENAHRKYKL